MILFQLNSILYRYYWNAINIFAWRYYDWPRSSRLMFVIYYKYQIIISIIRHTKCLKKSNDFFPANNLAFLILIWISGKVLERSNVNSSNTLSNFKFQKKSHDFSDCFFVWRSLKYTADTSIVSSVAIGNLIASYDQLKNCFGYIIRSYLGIPSFWWDTH